MPARPVPLVVLLVAMIVMTGCAGGKKEGGEGSSNASGMKPAPPSPSPTLSDTRWALTDIAGQQALPEREPAGRPWLKLDAQQRRANGSTGVNSFGGGFELSGEALTFGPMMSTRRAGAPELMQQESAFLDALKRTARARTEGQTLRLYDASNVELARFEATAGVPAAP